MPASIKLVHTLNPGRCSQPTCHRFAVTFFFWLRSRMVGAVKTHVCLWREREEGGQGIELREVRRPRRSSSCQKMSQKSAKSTLGSLGRSQLFKFGLMSWQFVRREGCVQKLVHHCHHLGKAIGHFVRFIGEPKRFGKCYLWPTFESQPNFLATFHLRCLRAKLRNPRSEIACSMATFGRELLSRKPWW